MDVLDIMDIIMDIMDIKRTLTFFEDAKAAHEWFLVEVEPRHPDHSRRQVAVFVGGQLTELLKTSTSLGRRRSACVAPTATMCRSRRITVKRTDGGGHQSSA